MTDAGKWYDVVVIGAGLAGLVATHKILGAGRTVLCVEARDRVGGRTLSIETDTGTIDLGASWYWSNEPRIHSLLQRLGLGSFPQSLAGDALFDTGQEGAQRLNGNPIDSPSLRFARGAQSLPLELASLLPEGSLALNEPVEAITVNEDSAQVVTRTRRLKAGRVVLAVPPALAAASIQFTPALPDDVRALAESTPVWMGGMVKAVAVYRTPFWRRHGLSGSAISHAGPFREFHDHSGPDGSPAAIFGFAPSSGLVQGENSVIADAFRDQLVRMFGVDASDPAKIHVTDWSAEPYTQPSRQLGANTSSYGHRLFRRPIYGRIHWASTETAPSYAGHLEGAATAGILAAQATAENEDALRGNPAPLVRP
ncbi:NAD(P)/FAD-dependent oxidoreductase [Arthrobacter sp. NtRootA1]|uniref:flavin monoamine oxidase family protein n=1 Tax=Micrococcaceae TaxID=1268 RepID=UPI001CC343AB|nr:NAD(P)/FAD-dependent oxidoreductase [Arthrobacter sp. NtRootA1]BCW06429.1 monoamine oxidase [Arthrobacter sp. NtRootA1]